MLNEVKHLAIAREILRCAQNDIIHRLTFDRILFVRDYYSMGLQFSKLLQEFWKPLFIDSFVTKRYDTCDVSSWSMVVRR
jgi:hypothetical protein